MNQKTRNNVFGPASAAFLIALIAPLAAEDSDHSNIDLCNSQVPSTPDQQIDACTELLKSAGSPRTTAILYNNRGNAQIRKEQYDLAIKDFDEALKADPNDSRAFNNRGVAYEKKQNYDSALSDFDSALRLNPNYANAFANRGETFEKKGDYIKAAKDFDEALRLQPDFALSQPQFPLLRNERCWVRTLIGDLPAALADCNAAIQSAANDAAPFDSRGLIYLRMNQWDLAIADYDAALRIDPKLASALYGRGFARIKKGEAAGGNSDMASAKVLDPGIAQEFSGYGLK